MGIGIRHILVMGMTGLSFMPLAAQFEVDLSPRYGITGDAFRNIRSDSLERIASRHPSYAYVMQELAERLLEQNTVYSRYKAEDCIRRALKIQPGNTAFRFTLVKVLLARGFYQPADNECDKLIEQGRKGQAVNEAWMAQIYFYKGWIAERQAFRYRNMRSTSGSMEEALDLNLSRYSENDFRNALNYYKQVLTLAPDHSDARQRMGMLLFEIRNYQMMLGLFQGAIRSEPSNKNNWLYAGLAAYHLKLFDLCNRYYQKALSLLNQEEYYLLQNIDYIVPAGEFKIYKNYKNDQKQYDAFVKKFWNKRDPLYLTGYNERQLEHFNRMAYVSLRFSVPRQGIEGWQTERGIIYIRYGKPAEWFRIQPDERTLGGWEIWVYSDNVFRFRDEYAAGYFLMDDETVSTAISAYNTRPDDFVNPMTAVPVDSRLYQFRSSQRYTQLLWVYHLDRKRIPEKNETDTLSRAGCFLLNSDFEILNEQTVKWPGEIKRTSDFILGFFSLEALPNTLERLSYSIEMYWPSAAASAVSRKDFTLRNFSGDTLMISDVILSEPIAGFSRSDLLPLRDSIVTASSLLLYFEVYNLFINPDGKALYSIETRIRPRDGGYLSHIWNQITGNSGEEIRSSFNVTCLKREDSYFLTVDLSNVKNGNCWLDIQVTDQQSKRSVLTQCPIVIRITK